MKPENNSAGIESKTYLIKGMDCPTCALTIEKGVEKLDGVHSVEISYAAQKIKVSGEVREQQVIDRVHELGYELLLDEKVIDRAGEPRPAGFLDYVRHRKDARFFLIGFIFILPGLILHELLGRSIPWVSASSIIALVAGGFPVFRSAFQSLRYSREININVLMSIAVVGAVIIGAYTEAGMVMILFLLGEIIEGYAGERTRDAIRGLMNLVPQHATKLIRNNGRTHSSVVPVSDLQVGDQIVVKPGENIPMDGVVIEGISSVNQASITGESRLVEKETGSQVFASSINGEGAILVEVTHLAEDNTISRLIQLVEDAQEKRSTTQRFVDRFAKVYTPIVVAVAVLVAVIPPLFFNEPFLNPAEGVHGWLYRGLALLVVGCPCALVISTPVSIISAISNAARHGILIKGGIFLEELSRIKAFAFDKTGTLTEGKPKVVSIRSIACINPNEVQAVDSTEMAKIQNHMERCESCTELVAAAGAVEAYSEHPLAGAIVDFTHRTDLKKHYSAENVNAIVGRGVVGRVNGITVVIGSHRYFDENYPHLKEDCEAASADAMNGLTPLMVEKDETFLGTITLGDVVRSSSSEALAQLRLAGMKSLIMLTGDEPAVAKRLAPLLGLDEFHAQLLPGEKVDAVRAMQARYGKIVMVGDGINDAPALAAADIGIAMSSALGGTAQAMETGDITLMSGNLRRLSFLVHLSKTTMNRIYFNVFFAILVKLFFFVLVILGYGTMWMAVFADVGTTLLVTLNGMRLLRNPQPREG